MNTNSVATSSFLKETMVTSVTSMSYALIACFDGNETRITGSGCDLPLLLVAGLRHLQPA